MVFFPESVPCSSTYHCVNNENILYVYIYIFIICILQTYSFTCYSNNDTVKHSYWASAVRDYWWSYIQSRIFVWKNFVLVTCLRRAIWAFRFTPFHDTQICRGRRVIAPMIFKMGTLPRRGRTPLGSWCDDPPTPQSLSWRFREEMNPLAPDGNPTPVCPEWSIL
jgi:hypothetical protein